MRQAVTRISIGITLLWVSLPGAAFDTGVEGWTVDGRVRQGFSSAYDLPGLGTEGGPADFTAELKSTYSPNRYLTFIGDFWLRADFSTRWNDIQTEGGLVDPASPRFAGRLPMILHEDACSAATGVFCAESDELEIMDDAREVIRELSVKLRDPGNRYNVKFGKQQRGWGQSDGLRLLDILHAQDLRERFAFKDSDELRIPALMLATDFNLRELGVARPFEALGMRRPVLEFNIVPEVLHSRFIINNPTPSDRSSGGVFGLPFPTLRDPVSGFGLVALGANLADRAPARFSMSDAEYSMRLKFGALGGEATVNLFYGQQDLPVVRFTGANLIIGSPFNDEAAARASGGAVVPLPLDVAVGAYHGAYLPWLRSLAAGVPMPFPLVPFGCMDPVYGGAGAPCSLNANFELDYDRRQKVAGFSFARDLSDAIAFGPKQTSPTVRLEFAYESDKPFNRSTASNPIPAAGGGATVAGSNVLILDPRSAITESDVLSAMIGFDHPLWVPGWDTQQKSVFTSLQIFNIHTKDADEGLLAQAPYAFSRVKKNQQYATLLWNAAVMGERLVFEGLVIKDLNRQGIFYRQRVDFQFLGNRWRPRMEWMHFDGERESAPYGIFNGSDLIEFSLTYQF